MFQDLQRPNLRRNASYTNQVSASNQQRHHIIVQNEPNKFGKLNNGSQQPFLPTCELVPREGQYIQDLQRPNLCRNASYTTQVSESIQHRHHIIVQNEPNNFGKLSNGSQQPFQPVQHVVQLRCQSTTMRSQKSFLFGRTCQTIVVEK